MSKSQGMKPWLRKALRAIPGVKHLVAEHDASDWGEYVTDLDQYAIKGLLNLYRGILDRNARRRGGRQQLYWTDLQIRDVARELERYSPISQGILSGLSSYTLGDQGLQLEVKVAESVKQEDAVQAEADVKAVEDYLTAFRKQDNYYSRHKENYRRYLRDGEFFLRYFVSDDYNPIQGHPVRVRYSEPEFCVPLDGSEQWTFGCEHFVAPDGSPDTETIVNYNFQYTVQDNTVVPAQEIVHAKQGVDRTIKRGNSIFSSMAPIVIEALRCLTNGLRAETIRQSTTWITEHPDSTPPDLEAWIAGQTDYSIRTPGSYGTPGTGAGSGREYPVSETTGVGEVHLTGAQKLSHVPSPERLGESINFINAGLLACGSPFHIPLWIIAGDTSKNNSTDLEGASPFGITIREQQAIVAEYETRIHWGVVEIGVYRDDLPESVLYNVELKFTPQQPVVRDRPGETKRLAILYQLGVISRATFCQQEGYDEAFEAMQIKEEQAAGLGPPAKLPSPTRLERQATGATPPQDQQSGNGRVEKNGEDPSGFG